MEDIFDENQGGIFNGDGTRINPDLISTPDLCITCTQNESHAPEENVLCNLTRADGQGEAVFLCFAYQPDSLKIDRNTVLRTLCKQAGVPYTEDSVNESSEDDAPPLKF